MVSMIGFSLSGTCNEGLGVGGGGGGITDLPGGIGVGGRYGGVWATTILFAIYSRGDLPGPDTVTINPSAKLHDTGSSSRLRSDAVRDPTT